MCSNNTPYLLDFVGASWYTSFRRSIEHLFGRTVWIASSEATKEAYMTALLDSPLPQLRPPARAGSLQVPGPDLVSVQPTASVATAPTETEPVRPSPRRPVPGRPRRLRPRAHRESPRTANRPQNRLVAAGYENRADTSPRPPLRLTRRARLLITVCSVLTMLGIVGLAAVNAEPVGGSLHDAPARVVVQTGDTLWQIAAEVAPAEDPAAVVQLLRSANDLDSAPLQAGQVLVIPRR